MSDSWPQYVVAALLAVSSSGEPLRAADSQSPISDQRDRSLAFFARASKVLLHPRCLNCHPPDDRPRQGDQHFVHDPPAVRGPKDEGVPAMHCASCHQDRNLEHARVPGAPKWHLAPLEMAWLGRTPGQICEQIKDPARNGGKTLEQIWEHSAHDDSWPGAGSRATGARPRRGRRRSSAT